VCDGKSSIAVELFPTHQNWVNTQELLREIPLTGVEGRRSRRPNPEGEIDRIVRRRGRQPNNSEIFLSETALSRCICMFSHVF
jgi:hypothetical protein